MEIRTALRDLPARTFEDLWWKARIVLADTAPGAGGVPWRTDRFAAWSLCRDLVGAACTAA